MGYGWLASYLPWFQKRPILWLPVPELHSFAMHCIVPLSCSKTSRNLWSRDSNLEACQSGCGKVACSVKDGPCPSFPRGMQGSLQAASRRVAATINDLAKSRIPYAGGLAVGFSDEAEMLSILRRFSRLGLQGAEHHSVNPCATM